MPVNDRFGTVHPIHQLEEISHFLRTRNKYHHGATGTIIFDLTQLFKLPFSLQNTSQQWQDHILWKAKLLAVGASQRIIQGAEQLGITQATVSRHLRKQ
jgi:hypothetical protein